jgi:hypothetical protein
MTAAGTDIPQGGDQVKSFDRWQRSIIVGVVIAAFSVSAQAQLQNMTTDDKLPKSVKTVAVFFEIGRGEAAKYIPDFARAKRQVSEKLAKAKLQVAADPTDADIVLVVHELNEGATTGQFATVCLGDKLDVFKGGKIPSESDTPIWSVNEYCGISWPLNRAMDKLTKALGLK